MTKVEITVEHALVTFVEGVIIYITAANNPTLNWTLLAGAIGSGLSLVYNTLRISNPPVVIAPPVPDPTVPQVVEPVVPVAPVAPPGLIQG